VQTVRIVAIVLACMEEILCKLGVDGKIAAEDMDMDTLRETHVNLTTFFSFKRSKWKSTRPEAVLIIYYFW